MLLQLLANGIVTGSIYAIVALGFALVYNTTRIFHIAYAVVYMFAPYMLLSFYHSLQFPIILAFLLAIIGTIGLSLLIEYAVYRPLNRINSSLNVIMISSIGVMIVIINVIAMLYGNETKIIHQAISPSVSFMGIILTYIQIAQFLISLILIILFLIYLKYSGFGIKTRALRDDDQFYTVMGMDISNMRIGLFVLSGFFAAVGGAMVAYDVGMDPYVGMPMLLNVVVAMIVGGIGRFDAPILGGFIIGILQSLAVWAFSARWQDAVTFTLLILFLLLRPQGILGEKQRAV